jgi:hypothetical protein
VAILKACRVLEYGTCQGHAIKIIMVRLDIQTTTFTSFHGDFVKPKAKFEVGTSFGGCTELCASTNSNLRFPCDVACAIQFISCGMVD